jgi:hypothetical protein
MTLNQKISELLPCEGNTTGHTVDDIEKIADEFAVDFSIWCINTSVKNSTIPMTVLLKMYKNQKGL